MQAYYVRLRPQPCHLYADSPSPVHGDMGGCLGESPVRVPLPLHGTFISSEKIGTLLLPGNEKKRSAAHCAWTGNGWAASAAASRQFPPSASHEPNPGASGQQRHKEASAPSTQQATPHLSASGTQLQEASTLMDSNAAPLPNGYALVTGRPSSPW